MCAQNSVTRTWRSQTFAEKINLDCLMILLALSCHFWHLHALLIRWTLLHFSLRSLLEMKYVGMNNAILGGDFNAMRTGVQRGLCHQSLCHIFACASQHIVYFHFQGPVLWGPEIRKDSCHLWIIHLSPWRKSELSREYLAQKSVQCTRKVTSSTSKGNLKICMAHTSKDFSWFPLSWIRRRIWLFAQSGFRIVGHWWRMTKASWCQHRFLLLFHNSCVKKTQGRIHKRLERQN